MDLFKEEGNHLDLPPLDESWKTILGEEMEKDHFTSTWETITRERNEGHNIYPPFNEIFSALNYATPNTLKAVIIGQDPYHGPGQAHGLCFSVKKGVKKPPSLVNIFKELNTDLGIKEPRHGELTDWAKQGVLLLNAILSVREHQPGSHQKLGWQQFTDSVISHISESKTGTVFLLWGKFAQSKTELIDESKHFVLKAAHPSPYSANNGFFGCRHFSKTNELLKSIGGNPIDWNIKD